MKNMIFDGKKFAKEKERVLKRKVEALRQKGVRPKLVSILADDSKESALYVFLKAKFAQQIGVIFDIHQFAVGTKTKEIVAGIQKANADSSVHGIMIQLPVENQGEILQAISPAKDVDCLTEENLGLIVIGKPRFLPATVKAVMEIVKYALGHLGHMFEEEKWLRGKTICIIGASIIVGKPLSIILSDLGATVIICRSTTGKLAEFTQKADVLVSATGAIDLVKKEMVKTGAIVIDVGISKLLRDGKFRVVGDVSRDVLEKTSFLTPVPGGVGPVTVACLFENLLLASQVFDPVKQGTFRRT